ncbi:MAG: DUF4126 domain-containing protein [Pseudanabaenaceae cyanobacterium SKYGB_i_bin29]|nr:DUF4126 domain-containing protein [Pseudanabaenaceae cyanobacterium SKYG29]MDW8420475.1 DUF4126 domain-containing protein [Pseudanabaenaceae cyanobacterium SKYGB_i_bin29]
MNTLGQIALGLCLASAAGLRVFVALLVWAITSKMGLIIIDQSWSISLQLLSIFTIGAVVEVMLFFRPRWDNLLDAVALPLSAVVGSLTMASVLYNFPNWGQWLIAILLGGGVALLLKITTTLLRADITKRTGGINNGLFATMELGGCLGLLLLALLEPHLGACSALGLAGVALRYSWLELPKWVTKNK